MFSKELALGPPYKVTPAKDDTITWAFTSYEKTTTKVAVILAEQLSNITKNSAVP